MTPGEAMVWAAVYAATWTQFREFKHRHGLPEDDSTIATQAADEATGAVDALRELASGRRDFSPEANAVIKG